MATYTVNAAGVEHARELIDKRRIVLSSRWGDVQPSAEDENAYLKRHSWDEYGAWHLALTEGPGAETKIGRPRQIYTGAPERNYPG